MIYFSSSRADTEAYIGAAGELADTWEISGEGWTDVYESYRYSMRWFDGETPMNTYYQYRNGFLERIEIRPEETGCTAEQVRGLIEAMYGAPTSQEDGQVSWADPVYSKYITLSTDEQGCLVTVSSYSVGITNVLASHPVRGGQAGVTDPEDALVWEYLCSILPLEARQKVAEFNLFTDGTSNILAYTSPVQVDGVSDNTHFSISIDYYDVYDENGAKRDWSKLTYTILHEYGHVLLEDETQVDLTKGDSTHDPAAFIEGSFRKGFYDAFWSGLGDTGVGDYDANPTHYVSRYGANYFHEDIADTFAVFVLGGQPKGSTVAEEKLRFFWADPDMVSLRARPSGRTWAWIGRRGTARSADHLLTCPVGFRRRRSAPVLFAPHVQGLPGAMEHPPVEVIPALAADMLAVAAQILIQEKAALRLQPVQKGLHVPLHLHHAREVLLGVSSLALPIGRAVFKGGFPVSSHLRRPPPAYSPAPPGWPLSQTGKRSRWCPGSPHPPAG